MKVHINNEIRQIDCPAGMNILDALVRAGVYFSAVCGGNGKCGKCKIRLLEGCLDIQQEDEKFFDKEELEQGWRLSCLAYPKGECTIAVTQNDESDFEVLSEFGEKDGAGEKGQDTAFGIAIDIGTTTLAVSLVGLTQGKVIDTYTSINQQRAYGADVIARIQASNDGKKGELKKSIQTDLVKGIRDVIGRNQVAVSLIKRIAIAGNTTMVHLLMEYSCENLGVFPFTPVNMKRIESDYMTVLGDDFLGHCPVVVLPGISTFVGGDITSGLFSCGFHKENNVSMLVDLGTNGEMGIGNKDKILVTSTAAGPAFEGGNIEWGTGSIKGAICGVKLDGDQVTVRTIGDVAPVGICGTGVIETTSELLKAELIDASGMLDDDFFEDGFPLAKCGDEEIVFTQKDVREIQLAKSAVRAGIETLMIHYGVTYDQIDKVYLAGGFGFKMDKSKAVEIGMFPEELAEKIEAVGNSSLGGAVMYLLREDGDETLDGLVERSEEIALSTDPKFNEFYMEHMLFGEL